MERYGPTREIAITSNEKELFFLFTFVLLIFSF